MEPSVIGRGRSIRVVTALTSTIGSTRRSYAAREKLRLVKITELAGRLAWPEGPSVLADGRVVFVETYRSRLTAWDPATGRSERFAGTAGGPNATCLGADGCLYVTQNGGVVGPWRAEEMRPPSIQRVAPDGTVEIVATEVDGHRFQAPNDLAFGPDGRLYFTDPGNYDATARPDRGYICALEPDGTGEVLAELEPVYPNGIVVEAGGTVVWVESYTRAVKRRHGDGSVEELCTLDEGHIPDGLAVAANGDLYVTSVTSGGIDIVAPDGGRCGFLKVGSVPTNCAFAGSTLYVTDGGVPGEGDATYGGILWSLDLDGVEGMPLFPGAIRTA
jgi:gluconolactonase